MSSQHQSFAKESRVDALPKLHLTENNLAEQFSVVSEALASETLDSGGFSPFGLSTKSEMVTAFLSLERATAMLGDSEVVHRLRDFCHLVTSIDLYCEHR